MKRKTKGDLGSILLAMGTIAFCAFCLAETVGQVLASTLAGTQSVVFRSEPTTHTPHPRFQNNPAVDPKHVIERNLFCAHCKQQGGNENRNEESTTAEVTPLPQTRLQLELLATLMGNSAGLPSASIRSQSGVHFYRIGERHKSGFEVIDIQNRFVILQNGREKEVLPLIPKSAERITSNRNDNNPRPGKKRGIRNHWLREGIKTLGSNKYSISRSTLNRILSNTVELTRARIIPAITGGKSTGFRIYSIRPGSLFALLGMKNGDQVHAINARAIHTPEQALQAYAMLRSANHLSLAFTRRGKRMTSDYTITR